MTTQSGEVRPGVGTKNRIHSRGGTTPARGQDLTRKWYEKERYHKV